METCLQVWRGSPLAKTIFLYVYQKKKQYFCEPYPNTSHNSLKSEKLGDISRVKKGIKGPHQFTPDIFLYIHFFVILTCIFPLYMNLKSERSVPISKLSQKKKRKLKTKRTKENAMLYSSITYFYLCSLVCSTLPLVLSFRKALRTL